MSVYCLDETDEEQKWFYIKIAFNLHGRKNEHGEQTHSNERY